MQQIGKLSVDNAVHLHYVGLDVTWLGYDATVVSSLCIGGEVVVQRNSYSFKNCS